MLISANKLPKSLNVHKTNTRDAWCVGFLLHCEFDSCRKLRIDLVFATLDVVHDHVLKDVPPVFQFVHPVVGVGVEHRPAEELGQRLDKETGT